jgi:hypothetical protein
MKTMKIIRLISSSLAVLAMAALSAQAQVTYWSPNNGWVNGGWSDGAGISSVVVNNDANNITFTINSSQAMAAYTFYAVQLQIVGQAGSGYTALSNPLWNGGGPAIGISTGENAVLNFNSDGSSNVGATPYKYSGVSWVTGSSATYNAGGSGSTYATATVSLSSLGLSIGDSFYFDAVSTYTSWAGGYVQSAYGALDTTQNPKLTDGSSTPWNPSGATYYDSATDAGGTTFGTSASMYTVTAVPEPAMLALLGCGLVFLMAQRRCARQ